VPIAENTLISIITVCRNSEATIRDTLASVATQTYANIEYIIIDGGSTDQTLQIVKEYSKTVTQSLSENDHGIYDAMNKGIKRATGEYILFLNSDDILLNERVIEDAVKAISANHPDIVFGNMAVFNPTSGVTELKRQKVLTRVHVFKNMPCQPSVLYRRSVFSKCGMFNTAYRIVSDFDWMTNAILRHTVSLQYIEIALIRFRTGGISSNSDSTVHDRERLEVYQEYFSTSERVLYPFISRYFRTLTTLPIVSDILNCFVNIKLKNANFQSNE
jgi:glycosyltransferase involved in cell wall biosynthesis